jgi:cell division transport system permease protein
MKFKFIIRESFRGFKNAKLSTFASIFTICLALILIAIYFSLSLNSNKLIKTIKEKVELEIFLDDDISVDELNVLKDKLKTIGGVKQITYITKEEAEKIFEKEYGKDMLEILEGNPLPSSFKVNLYDEYKTVERINKITAQISAFPKVQDIIYPEKNLEIIENNTSGILFVNLIVLIVLGISSVFLVSNTIRLVINSKAKNIETLKLLGATNTFIRLPFLLEGIFQGILGGILSVSILYVIYFYFMSIFSQTEYKFDFIGWEFLLFLIVLGLLLGFTGSLFSTNKFLKTKKVNFENT